MKIKFVKEETGKVYLKIGENNLEITKEEFDRVMVPTNEKNIFTVSEKFKEKVKEGKKIIDDAVVAVIFAEGNDPKAKMTGMMMLSDSCKKYCKLMECSPLEFINITRVAHDKFLDNLYGKDEDLFKIKKEKKVKKDNRREEEKTTMSIGDMIKNKKGR